MEVNKVTMDLDEYNELLIKAYKYNKLMEANNKIESSESENSIKNFRPEISG